MTPEIQPLARGHRRIIFIFSILTFCVLVPLLVFYAVGYRFDFSGEVRSIKSVGGMYISAEADNVLIYVDNEPVEDMRIFQSAAYVQNLTEGMHQVHVQKEGLQTWVKKFPVFAHFVTEAQSFNMPEVPQLRLVTQYQTPSGASVLFDQKATSTKFAFASTTNTFFVATTTATSTYVSNTEYAYIKQLVASSTEEKERIALQQTEDENIFAFHDDLPIAPVAPTTTVVLATTTKEWNDVRLLEKHGEVYAQWIGKAERTPFYYCVSTDSASSTKLKYGTHVYESFVEEHGSTTDPFETALAVADRFCRAEIKIDRAWQSVQWFDFMPGSRDHVLMHLQDGVYVVEIDDRAWQNVQLLYPGYHLAVVLDGERIYIKDDTYYLEVYTELQAQ